MDRVLKLESAGKGPVGEEVAQFLCRLHWPLHLLKEAFVGPHTVQSGSGTLPKRENATMVRGFDGASDWVASNRPPSFSLPLEPGALTKTLANIGFPLALESGCQLIIPFWGGPDKSALRHMICSAGAESAHEPRKRTWLCERRLHRAPRCSI